jgi:hypothetical protein
MTDSLTTITLTLPAYASGIGDPRLIEANILMVTLAGMGLRPYHNKSNVHK